MPKSTVVDAELRRYGSAYIVNMSYVKKLLDLKEGTMLRLWVEVLPDEENNDVDE